MELFEWSTRRFDEMLREYDGPRSVRVIEEGEMANSSQVRWAQAMANLKSYFDEHESNVENRLHWAKVHDEVCGWITGFGTIGRLLDVGCRRGELMRSKSFPKNMHYFGIDPLKVNDFEYDFDFRCETLESTSFDNETFDFVVIKDSVDYFAEPQNAFSAAFRILKKGGRLLLSEDDHAPDRIIRSNAESTYPNGDLSTLQILNHCIEAGFSEVKKEIVGTRLFLSAVRPKPGNRET
jgi:SAM-dependent methyltransferase